MTITTTAFLSTYATETYALFREISPDGVYQLKRSADIYEAWAKRLAPERLQLAEITDDSLSKFLRDIADRYARATLRKIRGDLLVLLRAAAADGLCALPKKVRAIAKPKPKPRAWIPSQVAAIVAAADDYNGNSQIVPNVGRYFAALTMTAWDTGLRKDDLHSIQQEMIGETGIITITQAKTDDEHYCRVHPETLQALRKLRRKQPLAWPGGDDQFYYHWRRIVALAGVPYLGGMHALRKSAATEVARSQPGAVTRFLGHASAVADVHYIDRAIAGDRAVMPTALTMRTT